MSNQAAHQPSESFLKEVQTVAAAEAQAAKLLADAQARAAQIRAEAQAQAASVAASFGDKAVGEKDKIVAAHRAAADAQVKRILARGAEQARQLAARQLSDAAAGDIAESV